MRLLLLLCWCSIALSSCWSDGNWIHAAEDGLARTPPLGWRSWNAYGDRIDQSLFEELLNAMTVRALTVNNIPTSLADLGYVDIGMDDGWQKCGSGEHGGFHLSDGTPIIDKKKFPNMKALVSRAHSKGLKIGWYGNNCICAETELAKDSLSHYRGDAQAHLDFGFDSTKLDNCGAYRNLTLWYELLNPASSQKKILIENCHWGLETPLTNGGHCPYHFYRTSGDIHPEWSSIWFNLQTAIPFTASLLHPASRPGCWAYPDMLEVGNMANFVEDRSHFGAWCIISAPLILGFDLLNSTTMNRVWPIISNKEAIAVNQDWHGHPGRLILARSMMDSCLGSSRLQVWLKPLSSKTKKIALFFISNGRPECHISKFSVDLKKFGFTNPRIRDVWSQEDLDTVYEPRKWIISNLAGHDSRFYTIEELDETSIISLTK